MTRTTAPCWPAFTRARWSLRPGQWRGECRSPAYRARARDGRAPRPPEARGSLARCIPRCETSAERSRPQRSAPCAPSETFTSHTCDSANAPRTTDPAARMQSGAPRSQRRRSSSASRMTRGTSDVAGDLPEMLHPCDSAGDDAERLRPQPTQHALGRTSGPTCATSSSSWAGVDLHPEEAVVVVLEVVVEVVHVRDAVVRCGVPPLRVLGDADLGGFAQPRSTSGRTGCRPSASVLRRTSMAMHVCQRLRRAPRRSARAHRSPDSRSFS